MVRVEGNCCWNMSGNEGSKATEVDIFFPGQTGRKPSIKKITSLKSYKCTAYKEDKIAQNSLMYGGINYHNNFKGNMYTRYRPRFFDQVGHTVNI